MSTYVFSDIYRDYLVYAEKRHKKQGFATFKRNFELHILPYFKDRDLRYLTKIDIINWQTNILSKNFSNSFNNSLYYSFSSFIKYCVYNSYLEENIVLNVENFPKKIETKEGDVYSIWEFRKYRRYLSDFVYKQYFNFMFFYGTRPSEAMALKFKNFDGLIVNLKNNIHRRGNRDLDTPKNKSSVRSFKISLLMWIRIYKLKKIYIKLYGEFSNEYFVFGGPKPLSTSTIDRRNEEAAKMANIRKITPHQFRHSCATYRIHKGEPIDEVSRLLGHSKVSTTVDIYLHKEKRKHNFLFPIRLNF